MPEYPRSTLSSPHAPAADIEDQRIWASLRVRMFGDDIITTVDRFELRGRLGAGAHGIVYRAHDPKLQREVALKYVQVRPQEGTADRERLLDEARAVASLAHPNLLAVHDAGEFRDGVWIAMELVEGGTLRRFLDQRPSDARTLLRIFIALAEGLQHAHARGISHGDFKPDNVLLDASSDPPRPRIVDFGLAQPRTHALAQSVADDAQPADAEGASTLRELRRGEESSERTIHLRGTPAYMAPELFSGASPSEQSDQYAFCVTLHEAFYGARPFSGATRTALARRVLAWRRSMLPEPPLPSPPRWLAAVIERGLSPDPRDRHASMRDLAAVLREGVRGQDGTSRRWLPAVAGALLLVGGGLLVAQRHTSGEPATTAEAGCADAGVRADLSWDDTRRDRIAERFSARDARYRSEALAKLDGDLSRWQRQWKASRIELCVDGLGGGPTDEALRDFRGRCLDDQADQVEGFVAALETSAGEGEPLARAVKGASALPMPADCRPSRDLERRFRAEQARHDAASNALAPEVAATLRSELASLRGASEVVATVALLDAATELTETIERAEGGAASPLLLRARLLVAQLTARRGKHEDALGLARDAFHAAVAQQQDREAAELALLALWVVAELQRDPQAAQTWGRLAAAHIEAIGRPDVLHADRLEYAAIAAIVDGRGGEAVPLLETVLELRTAIPELRDTAYRTYNNLASAQRSTGDVEEALATMAQARAETERVLGTLHPQTGAVYNNYGTFATSLGRYAESDASLAKSLEIKRQSLGEAHPSVGSTWVSIAHLREMQKRYDDAVDAYAAAETIYTKALGPDHLRLATLRFNEAILFTTRERYEEAEASFEAFTRIQRVHHPEDHPDVLSGRINVADLRVRRGLTDQGLAELETIANTEPSTPMHPLDRANLQAALARAHAALGDHEAFARHLAEHRRICEDEYSGVDCLDASLEGL